MQKKNIWIIVGIVILSILAFFAWNLVSNIFGPSPSDGGWDYDLSKMTNEQIMECFVGIYNKNISDNLKEDFIKSLENGQRIYFCPPNKVIQLKSNKEGIIALGIRNILNNSNNFYYEISVVDAVSDCDKSPEEILSLVTPKSESDIFIMPNETSIQKIIFSPAKYPSCNVRYRVSVYYFKEEVAPRQIYASNYFDVKFN